MFDLEYISFTPISTDFILLQKNNCRPGTLNIKEKKFNNFRNYCTKLYLCL